MATGRQKAKHPLRFRWWMLPIVLIVGYFGGKSAWEYFKMISGRAPMVHVVAEIQVDDEVVKIDKTIACRKRYYGETHWSFSSILSKNILKIGVPYNYVSDPKITGAYLADGGAVLMPIPKACQVLWQTMKKGKTGNIVPKGYLPATAHVDNFADPQNIEIYATLTAYQRPSPKIAIKSYVIKAAKPYSFPSWNDEFDWKNPDNGKALYFSEAVVDFTPVRVFRNGAPDEKLFKDVKELTLLDDVQGYQYPKRGRTQTNLTLENTNLGHSFPKRKKGQGAVGMEFSVDNFFPAIMEKGLFVMQPSQRGVILLQRTDNNDTGWREYKKVGTPDAGTLVTEINWQVKLKYDDKVLELVKSSRWDGGNTTYSRLPYFYDPENEMVFRFRKTIFTFYQSP